MMDVVVVTSIEVFGRDEWNRLFPGELEDHAYYLAVEKSGLPDFEWLYFGIRDNGELRAAVPAFITTYELDTTLRGRLRRITEVLLRAFPRLLKQHLLALGSPVSETCHLGFAPAMTHAEKQRCLGILLRKVEEVASQRRAQMIAAKDAASAQDELWAAAGQHDGLRRQPGLPTALLDIRFATLDDYFASLSRATRKDLRRKLKAGAALRVEWRDNIDDILIDVMRLYRATYSHADLTFEELTSDYFSGVLRECGGRAACVTYWLDKRLVAFNLVLRDGERLLDKFLGMDYAVARKYNLYFYTWIENVRYCIAHGIALYQSGQGLHREKLRLGSRLSANWLWYRHRNRLFDKVFAACERLFRLDRFDAELAALNPGPRNPPPSVAIDTTPIRHAGTATKTRLSPVLIAWACLVGCEVLCQISLKFAGRDTGAFDFSLHDFSAALHSPWLWVAIGTYIGNFFSWMLILRKSHLSAAFPTSAIVFIAVMFASWLVFAESISWHQALGAAVIVFGIVLLGSGADEVQSAAVTNPVVRGDHNN
ncbi:MAG: GNAT family N-acetyltransferase [Rudaea sp.]